MNTLDGKRIIVAGAATGIGRATAIRVAAEGATVAAFDINDEDAETTLATISDAGGSTRYWHVDVTQATEVEAAVNDAVKWLGGGVDVLLHIAGVMMGGYLDIDEFPDDVWDSVIDINLKGSYLMAKHVTAHMKREGTGVIVLTSSGAGVLGGSSSYAYGSSKGGTHGLTMVLDGYLSKQGIRVNDVLPGRVDTPLIQAQLDRMRRITGDEEAYAQQIAELSSPDGVAAVMAFLASDDAANVRGSIRTI